MHTAEHILNQTMVRMFGCRRSMDAHIERKKSKCDYELSAAPSESEIAEIERRAGREHGAERLDRVPDQRAAEQLKILLGRGHAHARTGSGCRHQGKAAHA